MKKHNEHRENESKRKCGIETCIHCICNKFYQILLLLVPRWAGDNAELPSDSNIWKRVRVNVVFIS